MVGGFVLCFIRFCFRSFSCWCSYNPANRLNHNSIIFQMAVMVCYTALAADCTLPHSHSHARLRLPTLTRGTSVRQSSGDPTPSGRSVGASDLRPRRLLALPSTMNTSPSRPEQTGGSTSLCSDSRSRPCSSSFDPSTGPSSYSVSPLGATNQALFADVTNIRLFWSFRRMDSSSSSHRPSRTAQAAS